MKSFDEMVTEAVERVIPSAVDINEVKLMSDAYLHIHPEVGSGFIFERKIRGSDTITDLAVEVENKHKVSDKVTIELFLNKRKCSLKLSLRKRSLYESHNRMPTEWRGVKCPN